MHEKENETRQPKKPHNHAPSVRDEVPENQENKERIEVIFVSNKYKREYHQNLQTVGKNHPKVFNKEIKKAASIIITTQVKSPQKSMPAKSKFKSDFRFYNILVFSIAASFPPCCRPEGLLK